MYVVSFITTARSSLQLSRKHSFRFHSEDAAQRFFEYVNALSRASDPTITKE